MGEIRQNVINTSSQHLISLIFAIHIYLSTDVYIAVTYTLLCKLKYGYHNQAHFH